MSNRTPWPLLLALGFLACDQTPDNPLEIDDDGDGYSEFEGDCDDQNPLVFPTTWYTDADGDGFGEWVR